eukprot:XP_014055760.1 PREDICTED: inhibitor of Bruton tyrosine kinase-like isoform X2 [Salmo salar]
MSVVMATPDCTPKCRSMRHADEVVAALTQGSEGRLQAFLNTHCHNAATLRDAFGRTALHLAASLGKRALLEWLLERKSADLMVKDKESGWTALHRSVFYGHIHCLMSLVKHGGILSTQDKEGLSVLDLTIKDRPAHVVFTKTDPTEVYTWGNNTNFSLGHGNQESRHHPEIVDLFARTGVYVKQVVLCKFHSVFLSQKGRVYTCGHGQGGRLGHGDEQTYLVPRMVEGLLSHHCSQVAAAKDHTVVLTEEGYVYTFGLNTFHQLGLAPPPASSHLPKQVFSKTLKGRTVIGVAAGRFHTVLWTREAVYTVGLNGGQLGYLMDPNGERCVTAPRQVSALYHKDVTIAMAVASNGATLVVTEKGDVYLLANYQCKKLASRQLNIRKVLVSGGSLDHRVDPQVLNEGGGEKVAILALDEAGRVFCWRSVGGSVRQCRWVYGRQVFMSDIALSRNNMMFVTQEGEGFSGQWHGEYRKSVEKKDGSVEVCGYPEGGTVYERIRLEKLPYVHRAVSITMDSKGRNFGVLQSDPKTSLDGVKYENGKINVVHKMTANKPRYNQKKCSYLCDVTLRSVDGKEFPCHKCVLCARLEYFHSMLANPWIEATSCSALGMPTSSDILQVILDYVYTDESPTIKESLNVEFVCNVLVVADQLLITRLKEMCEVTITENLTLKNAAELLQFSAMYNAEQLKLSCIQFIVLNMAALLESKALDILSDDVLVELSTSYRSMIPAMQMRLITPYPDAPDLSVYEDRDSSFSSNADTELNYSCRETLLKKAKLKAKRKPRRRSDSSGGYTLSDIIQSPPAAVSVLSPSLVKSGKTNSMESLQELMTSDSEGSYMGVGSPRELQSPVFHDRPEEERAGGGPRLKTPPSTPTTTMRNGLPAEPPKSSALEHIPKVTASPALPLPVLDLRAIMDMEASSKTQSLGATPKSPGSVGSSSKQSPLPAKLSQKQRKMIAMATKEGSVEGVLSKSTPVITPSKSVKAWATPFQTPPSSRAFRDLLVEEESRVRNGGLGAPGRPVAQGPLVSAARRVNFKCTAEPPSEPERPAGPWVLGAAGSPPTASMVTFASIVEEEKQQEAALIRSREKLLALIQIEEAAIQELLHHYGARNNPNEMIVVERSVQGPIATPFWNKH